MARSRAVCECTVCGYKFLTEKMFNKHRTGSYGEPIYSKSRAALGYTKHQRRCLNEEEMVEVGLYPNDKGIWTTSIIDDTDEVSEEQEREEIEV